MQQLARVVPLVHGVRDVETLVALEADQPGARGDREGLRRLGLADARLALEEQRLLERKGEEQRGRETAVGQVVGGPEGLLEIVDRAERAHLTERSWGEVLHVARRTGAAPVRGGRAACKT